MPGRDSMTLPRASEAVPEARFAAVPRTSLALEPDDFSTTWVMRSKPSRAGRQPPFFKTQKPCEGMTGGQLRPGELYPACQPWQTQRRRGGGHPT